MLVFLFAVTGNQVLTSKSSMKLKMNLKVWRHDCIMCVGMWVGVLCGSVVFVWCACVGLCVVCLYLCCGVGGGLCVCLWYVT